MVQLEFSKNTYISCTVKKINLQLEYLILANFKWEHHIKSDKWNQKEA